MESMGKQEITDLFKHSQCKCYSGSQKIQFPQVAHVSLIFPFLIKFDDVNAEMDRIRNYLERNFQFDSNNGPENKNAFIVGNSRHFDYIENVFLNNPNASKNFTSKYENNFSLMLKDEKVCRNFLNYLLGEQVLRKFKIKHVQVIMFNTGIGFLVIKLKLYQVHFYQEYFDSLLLIKDEIKKYNVTGALKKLICESLKINESQALDKLNMFDVQDTKCNFATMRFQMFSEVVIGKKNDKEYKIPVEQNQIISDRECEIIANYFVNRNSIRDYSKYDVSKISSSIIFPGSKAFCTEEGVLVLTVKGKENIDIFRKTYDGYGKQIIIRNLFYSYIIALHLYYYLHHLKRKIAEINTSNNIKKELRQLKVSFTVFKTNYMFQKVSQFYYQECYYKMLYKCLAISSFAEDVEESFAPLEKLLRQKRADKFDLTAKIFAGITISNVICTLLSIYCDIFKLSQTQANLIVGIITIVALISSLTAVFLWNNDSRIEIKKPFKKNRKK